MKHTAIVVSVTLAGAAGLAAARAAAPVSGVWYKPGHEVSAAFVKGQPLVERENYKVHASHRDQAGQAEVHEADTDIVYVLEGTATFVTGGTLQGGTTVAVEEIRGSGIQGGDTRELGPGDVIIVPAGVPHRFSRVSSPFNYYVVKVRKER